MSSRYFATLSLALPLLGALAGCTDAFLERAAREPGAVRDSSGLVYRSVTPGTGAAPTPDDHVKIRYRGTLADGKVWGESGAGEPTALAIPSAIPCWRSALLRMKVGEKARLVCPWYTTFAQKAVPPNAPRDTTLLFDLELVSIETAPAAPGMEIRTLREGDGPSPGPSDTVKVHYEGRLASGKVFDSSIARGEPAVFPLSGVIQCWTQLIPRMKVGEKAELHCPWIVAYGERGNPPSIPPRADLTFEVELLGIEK